MFKNFLKMMLLLSGMSAFSQQKVTFYQSAHPDDWQLFMNPDVYNNIQSNDGKVVIVHTTAGDAGNGANTTKYFEAREEGIRRAVRFMVNANRNGLGSDMKDKMVVLNNHNIRRCDYGNVVLYLLRLPDGNFGGGGFSGTGDQSLQKLFENNSPISAIDGTTTYATKSDLTNTIKALVQAESNIGDQITFCLSDTDTIINPGDHSDHKYSSLFFQEVAELITNIKLKLYVDYHTANLEKNVFDDDLLADGGTWGATTSGIGDIGGHATTWEPGHNRWLARQYSRNSRSNKVNIALNKPVKTSGNEPGSPDANANDGDLSTFWGNNPYPTQWWQVDLGALYNVDEIKVVNYFKSSRYYQYTIEGSTDGINWFKIVDNSKNTNLAIKEGQTFSLKNIAVARYLKVNMLYNSANVAVHIVEFEAYGELNNNTALNLALGKQVTSTGNESGSKNSNVNDGNINTYWSNNPAPQSITVDLEDRFNVNKINVVNYFGSDRYYKYKVWGSTDSINWILLGEKSDTNSSTSQGVDYVLNNVLMRYVKVEMLFNSANAGVHVNEIRVYGTPEITNTISSSAKVISSLSTKSVKKTEKDVMSFKVALEKNPIKKGDDVKVEINSDRNQNFNFSVYDLSGKIYFNEKFSTRSGNSEKSFSSSSFSQGVYMIRLENDKNESKILKVIIE